MHVRLAYGRSGIGVDLPDDPPVTIVEPRPQPGLPDERTAILAALRGPIGSPPLRDLVNPDDTVAIVFSDLTRPMPNERTLPPLLDELAEGGVADSQITLVNGLGTHRPQSDEELRRMLGSEVVSRYTVVQHNAWDAASMVEVGANHLGRRVRVNLAYMRASVRVLTGFIEPHFFAGFSGGPKAVLPGIADADSILDNHGPDMIAHPRATWAVTEACLEQGEVGNPVWEEMLSVAQSTQPSFVLNVTLNQARQITGVFAGGLLEAHRAGTQFARQSTLRPVAGPFDIVITSNSGYPLDLNLYQAVKGMSAASLIVRPGGDIVVAAECWDGIPSHGEYRRLLGEARSPKELLDRVTVPGYRCQDQWEAQIQAQIQLKARVHVYTGGLSDDDLCAALVMPCRSIEATVAEIRRTRPGATIAVLPDGPQTVPHIVRSPIAVSSVSGQPGPTPQEP